MGRLNTLTALQARVHSQRGSHNSCAHREAVGTWCQQHCHIRMLECRLPQGGSAMHSAAAPPPPHPHPGHVLQRPLELTPSCLRRSTQGWTPQLSGRSCELPTAVTFTAPCWPAQHQRVLCNPALCPCSPALVASSLMPQIMFLPEAMAAVAGEHRKVRQFSTVCTYRSLPGRAGAK